MIYGFGTCSVSSVVQLIRRVSYYYIEGHILEKFFWIICVDELIGV